MMPVHEGAGRVHEHRVRNVSKSFGSFAALRDVSFEVRAGELVALLGPVGMRQDDAAANHGRAGDGRSRDRSVRRRRRRRAPGWRAPCRIRLSALRALPPHDGLRERRLRLARAAAGASPVKGRDHRESERAAEARAAGLPGRPLSLDSSRADSGSGSRSPAPLPSSRKCCCSTSRSARSTPRSARSCGAGCAGCTKRFT